ncbi:hypothetical protein BG004_006945 [Podila humilis]|nr:hypothetical protein BG004_006945 [Podila humilis]
MHQTSDVDRDGHTGIWDFNPRRYNPHLITKIIQHGGKGKRIPDALSKTIPIWCATINHAVQKQALLDNEKCKQQQDQDLVTRQEQPAPNNTKVEKTTLDKDEQGSTKQKYQQQQPQRQQQCSENSISNLHYDSFTDKINELHGGSTILDSSLATELRVPALDAEHWDIRYHSLPSLISRSEHAQIAEKIDKFADKLMRFTDLTPLTTKLLKPIRPIWITPQSFLFKDDPPDYSQVGFLPVICLSASRMVSEGMEERQGYLYVQGSGDDEEMWSGGLRPDLFWDNIGWLLEDGITPAECEDRARQVVLGAKQKQLEQSRHGSIIETSESGPKSSSGKYDKSSSSSSSSSSSRKSKLEKDRGQSSSAPNSGRVIFTPSMELCSEIKPSPIWIGNNASGRVPDGWEAGFDMVINCGAEIQRDPVFEHGANYVTQLGGTGQGGAQATLCVLQKHQWECLLGEPLLAASNEKTPRELPPWKDGDREHFYLHLPIAEGKKGQHQLLSMIPIAIQVVSEMYGRQSMNSRRILVHCQQGMDRSVGITLALLVACFDKEGGQFLAGRLADCSFTGLDTSKEMIQKRLFQIMSHRLAARPSRATLKIINAFFMSPTDPPPAKYKS